jgi:hypothetical protein
MPSHVSGDCRYEPLSKLIGEEYYMHAYGSAYVVSSRVVEDFIAPNHHLLRKTRNEGAPPSFAGPVA